MISTADSWQRLQKLIELLEMLPASPRYTYDREYYGELRTAHWEHLSEADRTQLKQEEALCKTRIDFVKKGVTPGSQVHTSSGV